MKNWRMAGLEIKYQTISKTTLSYFSWDCSPTCTAARHPFRFFLFCIHSNAGWVFEANIIYTLHCSFNGNTAKSHKTHCEVDQPKT